MAQQKTSPLLPMLGFALIVVVVVAAALVFHPNSYSAANQETTYHRLYGAPVMGGNYSFTPPITKYQAINIALNSDNWTSSELQNRTVFVSLERIIYYRNITAFEELDFASKQNITLRGQPNPNLKWAFDGFEVLGETSAPISNYQPVVNGSISLRYVWAISIQTSESVSIPPCGNYMVDAATSELVPYPGHILR